MSSPLILGAVGTLLALSTVIANAATCTLRSSSGSCLMYSKGATGIVNTDTNVINQGGASFDVTFTTPTDSSNLPVITAGRVTCANSGKKNNLSPGIQIIDIPNFFSETGGYFNPTVPVNLLITKQDIHGGVGEKHTPDLFYQLTDNAITPCPNPGWSVIDAVACSADLVVTLKSGITLVEKVKETCSLDACQTLGANAKGIFDTRQYTCGPAVPQ